MRPHRLTVALLAACVALPPVLGAPGTGPGITSPLGATGDDLSHRQVTLVGIGPVLYVETRSHRAVTVGLEALDHEAAVDDPAAYRLACPGDPHPQPAVRAGTDRQVTGFDAARRPVVEHRLHLLFARRLPAGADCRLTLDARGLPVRFDPARVTGSIQVNQTGYAPDAPKTAFLGNWLGTAGPLPVDDPAFEVIDADGGAIRHRGQAALRAPADPWSGNDVWQAEFTGLDRPGRYRLRVAGLGVSDPFEIGAGVYDGPYRTGARLFYHSRNGTPVTAPWADAGHARPEGGVPAPMDAVFAPDAADGAGTAPVRPGERRAISRGWFDAGDFGQYVANAAVVWYQVGAAFDLASAAFGDGELHLPESGNGVPDLLDELEWGLDWMLAMQDARDGGVWSRVASRTWDSVPPHRIAEPRLIGPKTTHATLAFAAACAIHARLVAPWRPERSERALAAARAAWDFALRTPQWPAEGALYKNPKGIHAGEYADPSARDNRLWAAAELFRATGEPGFREAYETLAPGVRVDPTGNVSFRDQALAALWAWVLADVPERDPELVAQARRTLIGAADWRLRKMEEHPFRAPVHQHIGYVGWGSYARSTAATLPLLMAWKLTGEDGYRAAAFQTADTQLGANPLSISFITGIGARSPRFPLSKLSQFDGVDEPLRGIPVHGPHYHLPALWGEMRAVGEGYLPPAKPPAAESREPADFVGAYPVLRRFTDSDALPPMTEPTVAEYAQTAVAYGLLRRLARQRQGD